jgi:hypothetical protein
MPGWAVRRRFFSPRSAGAWPAWNDPARALEGRRRGGRHRGWFCARVLHAVLNSQACILADSVTSSMCQRRLGFGFTSSRAAHPGGRNAKSPLTSRHTPGQ